MQISMIKVAAKFKIIMVYIIKLKYYKNRIILYFINKNNSV